MMRRAAVWTRSSFSSVVGHAAVRRDLTAVCEPAEDQRMIQSEHSLLVQPLHMGSFQSIDNSYTAGGR